MLSLPLLGLPLFQLHGRTGVKKKGMGVRACLWGGLHPSEPVFPCFLSLGWSQLPHFIWGVDDYKTLVFPPQKKQKTAAFWPHLPFPSAHGGLYLPSHPISSHSISSHPVPLLGAQQCLFHGTVGTWEDSSPLCSSLGSASVFLSALIPALLQK